MSVKGIIISGRVGEILARQKAAESIELGELLVAKTKNGKLLLQVYDLRYGSQLSSSNLELASGMKLEDNSDILFMDENIRNYTLATLKSLITIENNNVHSTKALPEFFSPLYAVQKEDISFLTKPQNPLYVGKLRSGTKVLDFDIYLPGTDVLTHHVLITATTGRGKSNLASVMLWNLLSDSYAGILVLDPHDEYYGRNRLGLKDHSNKNNLVYYTPNNVPPGQRTLKINIQNIKPQHFNGVVDWTPAQKDALIAYYRRYHDTWIEALIIEKDTGATFMEGTMAVVKRRLISLLNLDYYNNKIYCKGIFDFQSGQTTITDICTELENGKIVIVDTSALPGNLEILIGSMIAHQIFDNYKYHKTTGLLKNKPVISIVLEEAPRVLGKETLEKGPNIFSTIAREGRKFKIGLTAITQLPSLIPREILANINTKIILGVEMQLERQAIIDSASQDLSSDSKAIAALDKGEAIITSNFTRFAIPIKAPLFSEFADIKFTKVEKDYDGINLT